MNNRPHPGPLPHPPPLCFGAMQERENYSPPLRDANTRINPARFLVINRGAAIATRSNKIQNRAETLSLSPGERAGVRAVVHTNYSFSGIACHET